MSCLYEDWLRLHEVQLKGSNVPEHLWYTLYQKIRGEIFDAGHYFEIVQDEHEEIHIMMKSEIDSDLDQSMDVESDGAIFLIDHAWTFTADKARDKLESVDGLCERIKRMLQLCNFPKIEHENDVEYVLQNMYKLVETYRIGNLKPEESKPIWYVNDEFGSLIEHSDTPNVAMIPFFNCETQCAYSLLWPIDSVCPGDFITRDVLVGALDPEDRIAKLFALFPLDYEKEFQHVMYNRGEKKHLEASLTRDGEVLPTVVSCLIPGEKQYKIYTDLQLMKQTVTLEAFEFVETQEEADVVWVTRHIKEYDAIAMSEKIRVINQFPNEKVLTCKDLLYELCKRANKDKCPDWMADTYNMQTEFPELMREYQRRADAEESNLWICKPWNMARGLDITISQNAAHLARLADTGPKIACKYIEDPVLYYGKKFDLRYIVMLTSVNPLQLSISKVFYPRFANKDFELSEFHDVEKHLTVMNYTEFETIEIERDVFIREMEGQYPHTEWMDIEAKIYGTIKQLFTFATASDKGLKPFGKSRAVYGVDLMLQWNEEKEIQPVVLEVNYQPDLTRPLKHNPELFNDILTTVILDQPEEAKYCVVQV